MHHLRASRRHVASAHLWPDLCHLPLSLINCVSVRCVCVCARVRDVCVCEEYGDGHDQPREAASQKP